MILIVVENFLYGISTLFKELTLEYFGIFCFSIGIRATAKFITLQSMPPHLNISESEHHDGLARRAAEAQEVTPFLKLIIINIHIIHITRTKCILI